MRVSTILTLIFLAFAVILSMLSLRYPFEVRTGPLIAGIGAVVLLLAQLLRSPFRKKDTKAEGGEIRGKVEGDEAKLTARRYIEAGAWVLGLVAGIYVVGLAIACPLFTLGYLKKHGETWLLSISLSVAIFVLIYGVFGMGLHVILYKGILWR